MITNWLAFVAQRNRPEPGLPAYHERVYVLNSAIRTMAEESEAKPAMETGGVLVGFVDSDLNAIVATAASGPGPAAHHGPRTFNRDRVFCQDFLDWHAETTYGAVDFIGEWHKHREPNPWPSHRDMKTYRGLAADPDCHLESPLVLITGTRRTSRRPVKETYVCTNAFIFREDGFVPRCVRPLSSDAYTDLLADSVSDGWSPPRKADRE